jgi:hypothetical protein
VKNFKFRRTCLTLTAEKDKPNFFANGPVVFAPCSQTQATELKEYGIGMHEWYSLDAVKRIHSCVQFNWRMTLVFYGYHLCQANATNHAASLYGWHEVNSWRSWAHLRWLKIDHSQWLKYRLFSIAYPLCRPLIWPMSHHIVQNYHMSCVGSLFIRINLKLVCWEYSFLWPV